MKIKIMRVQIPNNVAGNLLAIRVKEYHQTRRGLKKNEMYDWYKKFSHTEREIVVE